MAQVPSRNCSARNDTLPSTIVASRTGGRPGSVNCQIELGVPYPGITPRRTNACAAAIGSGAPLLDAISAKSNPLPRPRHTGVVGAPECVGGRAVLDANFDGGLDDADVGRDIAELFPCARTAVLNRLAQPVRTTVAVSTTDIVEISALDPAITTTRLPVSLIDATSRHSRSGTWLMRESSGPWSAFRLGQNRPPAGVGRAAGRCSCGRPECGDWFRHDAPFRIPQPCLRHPVNALMATGGGNQRRARRGAKSTSLPSVVTSARRCSANDFRCE